MAKTASLRQGDSRVQLRVFYAYRLVLSLSLNVWIVAIVHHDIQIKSSTYEVFRILSISLTNKTRLRYLFDKTIFINVKEFNCFLFEGLFN